MDKTRAYITKWALTKGIVAAEGVVDGEKLRVQGAYPWDWHEFKLGEWHSDPAKAEQRACKMRDQKADQLTVQANKLRSISFELPTLI